MIGRASAAITAVVLLLAFPAFPEDTRAPEQSAARFETLKLWHEGKALFPTRVVAPLGLDPEEPRTMILALHGYASTAEAFSSLGTYFSEGGHLFVAPEAAYPVLLEDGRLGYDWWLYQMPENLEMHFRAMTPLIDDHLPSVVHDIRQRYRIDQVYVLGFSQGALTAYLLAIHHPDLFDGIIAFGGMTDTDWYRPGALQAGNHLRVLISHGRDDELSPFANAQEAADLLTDQGYRVTTLYFDGGHVVPRHLMADVLEWIDAGSPDTPVQIPAENIER